jgi:hypothetical protein
VTHDAAYLDPDGLIRRLPDRLTVPPPGPPPASGQPGRVVVEGPAEALTVGPDEVLVVICHGTTDRYELQHLRSRMQDAGLRDDQILLLGAHFSMGKAPRDQIRVIEAE